MSKIPLSVPSFNGNELNMSKNVSIQNGSLLRVNMLIVLKKGLQNILVQNMQLHV